MSMHDAILIWSWYVLEAAKARIASLQATLQRKDSVDQEPVIAGGLFSFDRVFAIGCAHA